MSCCIGGVCIPYTAIVPLMVIGIKWIADRLASWGLLPESFAKYLGQSTKKTETKTCDETTGSCCAALPAEGEEKKSDDTSSSSSFSSSGVVKNIETEEEWNNLLKTKDIIIVAKFTASWCKPCKAIDPVYQTLAAAKKNTTAKFVRLDVDELDEVAATYKVAMMPTFIVIKNDQILGTMSGSDASQLETFVTKHTM